MTVQFNIKSAEANALIARLAEVTGKSKTEAVTEAVRDCLARIESGREADIQARIARVMALVDQSRPHLPAKLPSQKDLDDMVFDDHGAPR